MVSVAHQEYLEYPLDYIQSTKTHRPMASVTLIHRVQSVLRVSIPDPHCFVSLGFEDQLSERGMMGPAFTLLVTSAAAARMDAEGERSVGDCVDK
jgi:hypothetical protein